MRLLPPSGVRQTGKVRTCNCGSQPPEDAQFCHRCGRPLFEPAAETIQTPPPLPEVAPPPAIASPSPIGFHNATALRVALSAACVTTILSSIQMPALFNILWNFILLVAGGFLAVYLYQRRTGEFLTVRSGARIGWFTGLFHFLIALVLFTFAIVALQSSGGVGQLFRRAMEANTVPEMRAQIEALLNNPVGLTFLVFGTLAITFVMLSILTAAGGALGAKVLERES